MKVLILILAFSAVAFATHNRQRLRHHKVKSGYSIPSGQYTKTYSVNSGSNGDNGKSTSYYVPSLGGSSEKPSISYEEQSESSKQSHEESSEKSLNTYEESLPSDIKQSLGGLAGKFDTSGFDAKIPYGLPGESLSDGFAKKFGGLL